MLTQMAGKRDQIISIQRATETISAYGEVVRDWQDITTVRAGVRTPAAREIMKGEKISEQRDYIFEFPVRATTIKYDDRILFDGRACDIISILIDGDRQQYYIVSARAVMDIRPELVPVLVDGIPVVAGGVAVVAEAV